MIKKITIKVEKTFVRNNIIYTHSLLHLPILKNFNFFKESIYPFSKKSVCQKIHLFFWKKTNFVLIWEILIFQLHSTANLWYKISFTIWSFFPDNWQVNVKKRTALSGWFSFHSKNMGGNNEGLFLCGQWVFPVFTKNALIGQARIVYFANI